MKIISFDPNKITKISNFFNEEIEKCDEKFIMFIFDDLFFEVKDIDEFSNAYESLLTKNNLPFAFYPYYVHFNKVLCNYIKYPNPKVHVENTENRFDIVNNPAMGMLVLNLEKLKEKNFKFSGNYNQAFYVQEVVMFCNEHDLYFSTLYFYDVYKSWTYLKSNIVKGFLPNVKTFKEEKEKFYQKYKQEDEGLMNFLEKIKSGKNNEVQMEMPVLEELTEEEKIQ